MVDEDMVEFAYPEVADFLARRRRYLPELVPSFPPFPSPDPSPVLPEISAPLLSPLPPSGAGGDSEDEGEP